MEGIVRSGRARLAQPVSLLLVSLAFSVMRSTLVAQTGVSASIVNRTAPNFSRVDLSHRKIELRFFRGKIVLLNFWATWCAPCLTEIPTFTEWQTQYGAEKFQVIGVSMDDAASEVIATIPKMKFNYPVLMGDEHLGVAYGGVLGLPVTYLIDRDGKIRARYQGAADLIRIKGDIQKLLNSQ